MEKSKPRQISLKIEIDFNVIAFYLFLAFLVYGICSIFK